jgi:hypothetical protein
MFWHAFSAQEVIDSLIIKTIDPVLKAAGYRKRIHTWHLKFDEIFRVCNLQLNKWNTSSEATFTVNLGVFHPDFNHQRNSPLKPVDVPKEYHCNVRIRIGQVMPGQTDHWWNIAKTHDNNKVAVDLLGNLERFALPWLDSFTTLHDMHAWFVKHQHYFDAAVAEHLLGGSKVNEFLEESHRHANPMAKPMMEQWAAERGYKPRFI